MHSVRITFPTPDGARLLEILAPLDPADPTIDADSLTVTLFASPHGPRPVHTLIDRMALTIARAASRRPDGTIDRRGAAQSTSSRDRQVTHPSEAIAYAVERGWLVPVGPGRWAVGTRPTD